MFHPLRMARDVQWVYPRPVTTGAVQVVALAGALAGRRLLPPQQRPAGLLPLAVAGGCGYVVLRLGAHSGWTKRFKHTVLDRFGGDVDDAQTWLLATGSGAAALLVWSRAAHLAGHRDVVPDRR